MYGVGLPRIPRGWRQGVAAGSSVSLPVAPDRRSGVCLDVDHQAVRIGEDGRSVASFAGDAEAQLYDSLEILDLPDLDQGWVSRFDVGRARVAGVQVGALHDH